MIKGFSKLSKAEKIHWLAENFFNEKEKGIETLEQYFNKDAELQQLHDEFIENTISNFYVPYAVAPNFLSMEKHMPFQWRSRKVLLLPRLL